MECDYEKECSNFNRSCFKCFNYNMFSPHKQKVGLQAKSSTNRQKKQGIDFENRGSKKYSQSVKYAKDAAQRQIASGALSHALGDMITSEEITSALAEFKERGSKDAKGAKQITIKKEWLEGIKKEAEQMGKEYYFLPFHFKGDNTDYVAMDFDILLSYVETIQMLVEKVRLLQMRD